MTACTEPVVEDATLAWLESLGYAVLHGPDIAAGDPAAERRDPDHGDVVLERRLREAPLPKLLSVESQVTGTERLLEIVT